MCEAAVESPANYDVNKSLRNQPRKNKLDVLVERLPELGENFLLEQKIGEGTFSRVYKGRSRLDPQLKVAVKHLIPTCHPTRIARELKCMHHLGGVDNIVKVIACYRMNDCVVFVMPYQPHDRFSSYMAELSVKELQVYLKGLLLALRRVHSHGIIHRDIKPSNFLYHRKNQTFLLVDFGLAQNVEECVIGDSTENLASIKIEPVNGKEKSPSINKPEAVGSSNIVNKKRKRESEESQELLQVAKRPALKPISNNFRNFSKAENNISKISLQYGTVGNEKEAKSLKLANNSVFLNDYYSKAKERNAQSSIVVRRHSFNCISSVQPNNSFVRIQNSQVKLVGGVFAKPLPMTTSPLGGSTVFSSPRIGSDSLKRCHCDGKPRICNMCITRHSRNAPRAGTPGFRPPEVLLKYPNQTTAVDIWAVGVIMLSIMSSTYPFFKSPDDITALAELITIFGTDKMKLLAKKLGRNIICSENTGTLDLRKLCLALRRRRSEEENCVTQLLTSECPNCKMTAGEECLCPSIGFKLDDSRFPDQAYDLLGRFLDVDPETRITAAEALQHPFFSLEL